MSQFSCIINSLLNDSKAIVNSYQVWKKNKDQKGSIEFYFSEPPFNGKFGVVAGIDLITDLIKNFVFSESDIHFLKDNFKFIDNKYFDYLQTFDKTEIEIYGLDNGDEFFKEEPVLIISGKMAILKLLVFPIKSLISFNSLICTNALRMKLTAGMDKSLLEFGLRRAQGPLAGILASKYAYLGGFNSVSNVLCGYLYNIPVKGTCAHSYIMSYQHINENKEYITNGKDLMKRALEIRKELGWGHTNLSELEAFVSFTYVYKESSLLLVDTFNTIESGVKNTIIVALALNEVNQSVKGIRLDSGDLALLSKQARALFIEYGEKFKINNIKDILVSASNDINENSLKSFNKDGHAMDIFGIGTNLVTCQAQPFLKMKCVTSYINNFVYTNIYQVTNKETKRFICDIVTKKKQSELKDVQEYDDQNNIIICRSKLLFQNLKSLNEPSFNVCKSILNEALSKYNCKEMLTCDYKIINC